MTAPHNIGRPNDLKENQTEVKSNVKKVQDFNCCSPSNSQLDFHFHK